MPAQRRRVGCILAPITLIVIVLGLVVAALVARWYVAPEDKTYAAVPDTAGVAPGEFQAFTERLRPLGLVCSDQQLAERGVLSRGCYRKDLDHDVRVEFLGPASGQLGIVRIDLDYIGASDDDQAHRDFDKLVAGFGTTVRLTADQTAELNRRLESGADAEFDLGWGNANLRRSTDSTSSIHLKRARWAVPQVNPPTLRGTLEHVDGFLIGRGYDCEPMQEYHPVECVRERDGDKVEVVANGGKEGISRLYVAANTGDEDRAMDLGLAEQAALLDLLGGLPAIAAKKWYADNADTAGGHAYVAGLSAYLDITDQRALHTARLELLSMTVAVW